MKPRTKLKTSLKRRRGWQKACILESLLQGSKPSLLNGPNGFALVKAISCRVLCCFQRHFQMIHQWHLQTLFSSSASKNMLLSGLGVLVTRLRWCHLGSHPNAWVAEGIGGYCGTSKIEVFLFFWENWKEHSQSFLKVGLPSGQDAKTLAVVWAQSWEDLSRTFYKQCLKKYLSVLASGVFSDLVLMHTGCP